MAKIQTQESGGRPLKRAVSDEDKRERRRAILSAAKRVFAERGYHATTIADVAKAADLSYGSIYWYFDSKEALFQALMDSEQRALRRHVAAAVGEGGQDDEVSRRRALADGVRAIFEYFEADKASAKLLFRDALTLGSGIERHLYAIYEGFIEDIERMIGSAQRHGVILNAPPRLVAFSVGGLIGNIAHRRTLTDDGFSAEEVADFVVKLILDGLRPR